MKNPTGIIQLETIGDYEAMGIRMDKHVHQLGKYLDSYETLQITGLYWDKPINLCKQHYATL